MNEYTALNSAFYWDQRHHDHSNEWAYRYATKEEITTNLFRGQNESYAHLGGRLFTHPNLRTGNHCETSCCAVKDRVEQAISHPDNFRSTKDLSEPGKNIAPHSYIDPFHG